MKHKTVSAAFLAIVAVVLTVSAFAGCRHDVVNADGETISAVITPLQIGPLLLPFGEKNVTSYGFSTGLCSSDIDSYGLFVSPLGVFSRGRNYGLACGLICSSEEFNGIAVGAVWHGNQNGLSVSPVGVRSDTNGLSVEAITAKKKFNGIDICLCNIYGTKGTGLQVIGLDCSGYNGSKITGCQIGGILTAPVHGAQIGAITYNPGIDRGRDRRESIGKCLNMGVMNLDSKKGVQVGVVNNTADGNPVQIGLFNTTFDGNPFQIGLLNINPNGFLPVFPFFNFSAKNETVGSD